MAMAAMNMVSTGGGVSGVSFHLRRCSILGSRQSKLYHLTEHELRGLEVAYGILMFQESYRTTLTISIGYDNLNPTAASTFYASSSSKIRRLFNKLEVKS